MPKNDKLYLPGLVNIQKNYGKSPFFMGKLTISMAIFNSYVTNYQRVYQATLVTAFAIAPDQGPNVTRERS